MVAATVITVDGSKSLDKTGAITDDKVFNNTMAMTANGVVVSRGVYKATLNPASLINAAGETIQLTGCTGVVLGKTAIVGLVNPIDLRDITVSAYVQANGVIELRFQNEGEATVDLGSAVWYVMTETIRV